MGEGGQVHSGEGQGASLSFSYYNMISTHYLNNVLSSHMHACVCMCVCVSVRRQHPGGSCISPFHLGRRD